MNVSPLAGKPTTPATLVDVPRLVTAYYTDVPDSSVPAQRVAFGTSGHRGSAFENTFNQWHVLAISQAICDYRKRRSISGPLFLGIDSHALSVPACASALEVLAANGVDVMLAEHDEYTPTPAVSHAILTYNRGRTAGFADGIVVTPSHNPPDNGGFKYNPPNGGPADKDVTGWIEARANAFLEIGLRGVERIPYEKALHAATTHRHDYLNAYVRDLDKVIDMEAIRGANISMGVDPLGGAGIHYWGPIAERYGLNLTVVNEVVDPTFRFMTVDWDGRIRMDPSSPYAMRSLIGLKDRFDIAFACDTDHDRHGIVTQSTGLLPPNHYLSVAVFYLFQYRPMWRTQAAVGKTVVSSQMIDRVTAKLGRKLYEVPVGFKWFVDGLLDGSLGFGGEESAGASFLRRDDSVWTTDKDGIAPALLAAEITARVGRDPGDIYREQTREFGDPAYDRIEAPATPAQKERLSKLSLRQVRVTQLGGEKIERVLDRAPGKTTRRSVASRWSPPAAGSPHVRPARRIFTRSMLRAFVERIICDESWTRHKQSSTTHLRFEGVLPCSFYSTLMKRSITMKTDLLKVAGMTCGGCTSKVTHALKAIPGVSDVTVSLSAGEATVHYDERLTSPEQLKAAVKGAGYGVDVTNAAHSHHSKGGCCG